MIFLDKVKNMRIYKTQLYLPTLKDDKKKSSLIFLLSPNYNASNKLMNNSMFVNRLRYQSYYLERDLAYYIDKKTIEEDKLDMEEVNEAYQFITETKRSELPDSAFGVPSKRKFPLDTEAHVRSAIKFFNYVDPEDEAELARRIKAAMKKFNITDVHVSERNRFSKYYKNPVNESMINFAPGVCPICERYRNDLTKVRIGLSEAYVCSECKGSCGFNALRDNVIETSTFLSALPESNYIKLDDRIILTEEINHKYDTRVKRLLFKNRIRTRKEVLNLLTTVQNDNKWIKYAYPDIKRYYGRNIFVDLYYYMNLFLQNNQWTMKRGFDLFYDFMSRLLDSSKYEANGYKKKTVFIPVEDWNRFHDNNIWNFRVNINPISIAYHLMFTENISGLQKLFKGYDVIFVGNNCFFKLDTKAIDSNNVKSIGIKFKNFCLKICNNEQFDQEDIDDSYDNNMDKDVIKANIIDKLDTEKNIDITPQMAYIDKQISSKSTTKEEKKDAILPKFSNKQTPAAISKINRLDAKLDKKQTVEPVKISKLALNDKKFTDKVAATNNKKIELSKKINNMVNDYEAEEEIMNDIEDDIDNFDDTSYDPIDKETLIKLVNQVDTSNDIQVEIPSARSERMKKLDDEVQEKEIKGSTIKEIIEKEEEPIKTTHLDIASPDENWKNLKYINFDKNYNIDKDILNCFMFFSKCSQKLSIVDISVENTSTSEDRIETYRVQYEDLDGKRFTIKLDIPLMEDNRFLLRGYNKTIQTQLTNMPILKTDTNACQIISNYSKIFVYRFGESQGRALPLASKFIKGVLKHKDEHLKVTTGNARKVCPKYDLPIDYIAIASYIVKLETSDWIMYFNQDDIYNTYDVEQGLGFPYLYDKHTKSLVYYNDSETPFVNYIVDTYFVSSPKLEGVLNAIDKATSPTKCAYSSCSIMSTDIPLAVLCSYHIGLRRTLEKAGIKYILTEKLTPEIRRDRTLDYVTFSDGYLVFRANYFNSLLLNGLKVADMTPYSITEIDNKGVYLELLDQFGGRLKADGLENFYDLMMDPITVEVCEHYKLPSDYISALLFANGLLADNKYYKHTNMRSRRLRHYELIAVYTYKVLSESYYNYANQRKHKSVADFMIKQSAVIDKFLTDTITSDDSCINALRDVETNNSITAKGPSGMNTDRAYSLDKRSYDESMTNIMGMSTGFAGNVGVTRQATIDANVEGVRGYVQDNEGNTENMSTAKTLTATEALTPFGYSRDDPFRTAMTFIQTSKHMVVTKESDPLLVTTGADEAMPYLTSNQFAFKAKMKGIIEEVNKDYIIIKYEDGTYDYVNLEENLKKNSDGGYYVTLKLDKVPDLKKGMTVSENQIVAYDKLSFSNSLGESDNLAYNVGKLTKVAVLNTDDNFEDSGIITEKLSHSLATPIVLKEDRVLEKDAYIYEMAKVGQKVEVGDPLLVWKDNYGDEDARALLKTLSKDEVSELGKKKITSPVTGVVQGIKMYRTVDLDKLSESLQTYLSQYEEKYEKLGKKLEGYGIDKSKVPAYYALGTTGKLKKAQDAVYIEFFIKYEDTVGIGDKIVMMSANKQVISRLIPDDLAPYTASRPNEHIDAIVAEVSISKRMVQSIAVYGSLQRLMVELDRKVKDILEIPYDDSTV